MVTGTPGEFGGPRSRDLTGEPARLTFE